MIFYDLTDSEEAIDADLDAGRIGYEEYLERFNNLRGDYNDEA